MTMSAKVRVWEEEITIPTYKVHAPEKSPLFLEKRAYQGSTGKVYPMPVTEKISDKKEDVAYKAVFLENTYLKVMILPELGGRIQRALDKTNHYDFVYYNHVIKPALVGLTGPWISGGIEFNWPQHHRPSTYMPVDYHFSENADGSCSVYVSEIDRMYGTKGMGRFTLYPDKAFIEITGQIYNRTDTPQTFLWWANPAVPVNDNTYSVFPPDVNAVMDHGKRAVSTFPIATGEYYKYDYSAGIDISMYKNVKVPTSYMAASSEYDFIGNYDEGIQAGLLHVADHHISPGKKQWTWGCDDFGQAWDRNLTDEDGPYIELMTGVFTDNQPDFTWLKPYEEKTFTQYFMPYKGVGRVKNANKDLALNFTIKDGKAVLLVYSSGRFNDTTLLVRYQGKIILEKQVSFIPCQCEKFELEVDTDDPVGFYIGVQDNKTNTLLEYTHQPESLRPIPEPAEALAAPVKLKSTEECYLAAQHLEQYRHATVEPADYYEEGLKRDPTDIRLNNGYGLLLMKRGHFTKAVQHFRAAVAKQTWKNPNPYYGESYFNLGLGLLLLNQDDNAYDAFYKSTWSHETQSAGFYQLAALACKKKNWQLGLEFAEKSLLRNWHNMKARTLKGAILRHLNQNNKSLLEENLVIDPLDMGTRYEQAVLKGEYTDWQEYMRLQDHNYLELALDYLKWGMAEEALDILARCKEETPLKQYYMGVCHLYLGEEEKAIASFKKGENCCPDCCFPSKMEEIIILEKAIEVYPEASFAKYYLGCLLYHNKQWERAIQLWEAAAKKIKDFSIVRRNLAIAYFNKEKNCEKAMVWMKQAYSLEPDNSRLLLEYDQLCGCAKVSNQSRYEVLEEKVLVVKQRDALYLEYITLLNSLGKYQDALDCIRGHKFHPWEGGEGKVSGQYRLALTQLGIKAIEEGRYTQAEQLLLDTLVFPENLGEGKLPNVQDTIAYYYLGQLYDKQNQPEKAEKYFTKASTGLKEPSSVLYYNDQPSDTIFYQGLANLALGKPEVARKKFHQLLAYGEKHIFDQVEYDFFAVSLPELEVFPSDIKQRNDIYCRYLMGLANLGLGNKEKAQNLFAEIIEEEPAHQGAILHQVIAF